MPTSTSAMGSREEQAQSHAPVIRTDLCHLFLQTHPQLLGSRVQSSNQLLGEPDITESFSCLIHGHSRILQESTSPLSVCRLWDFLFSLDTQVLCLSVLSAMCVHVCACVCVCVCLHLVTQSCLTLLTQWMVAQQAPLSMDSPGKNTGLNPSLLCLLYCRRILYPLSHQGNQAHSYTAAQILPMWPKSGFTVLWYEPWLIS